MKIIIYSLYVIKIIYLNTKIIINIFGIGGILTLSLLYFNFFNIIWMVLGVILEKFFPSQWWGGIFGLLISQNNYLWGSWCCLFLLILIHGFLNFGKSQDVSVRLVTINYDAIITLMKNLKLNPLKIKIKNNNFFCNISLEMAKTSYPMAYIYYDIAIILKENFNILKTSFKNHYLVDIIINYNHQFNTKYIKRRKIFYMMTHWNYLFFFIIRRRNFINLGINHHNQLMIIPLKKLYNFFMVDKHHQFNTHYNSNYIFKDIFSNPTNIIYLINNMTSTNIVDHYKKIVGYLENAFTQSKINKNPIILFFYNQFQVFKPIHKKFIDYLKFLIKNSIGYFNVVIIENNSQTLMDLFYNENFIDDNSAIFLNGVDNWSHSKILTGSYGFELSKSCYYEDKYNKYYCQLPNLE